MARKARPWYRADRNAWYVYRDGKQINLGADEKQAWERFQELSGTKSPTLPEPQPKPDASPTISALITRYLAWYQATRAHNSWVVASSRLSHLKRDFGEREPDTLTPGQIEEWICKQGWTQSTRRGVMIAVKALLNWAIRERAISADPLKGIAKPKVEQRDLLLSDADHQRLLQGAAPDLRVMLSLLNDTGARPNVLCQITADNLDMQSGMAMGISKGRIYRVYLSADWLTYMGELARFYRKGPLLRTMRGRPWTPNGLLQRLKRLGNRLNIQVYPYAYRHRFTTRLLGQGVAPAVVAALLNHTDLSMISEHYNHIQQTDHLRVASQQQNGPPLES